MCVHGPESRNQDFLCCLDCNKCQAVGVHPQSRGLADTLLGASHLQEQFLHVKVKGSVREALVFLHAVRALSRRARV